ncbi:UDP-N-acetylglucosamine transferase subunit ALG14 isoform X2 [Panthera onca]|uniref:UDP-N-acetylglucosamine transferase subunit ALG14 homolog isoform X2 n=1 Tax=Panthera leo TaxID=9689 RepID=UPI000904E0B8|nr:UDP-N-acetylglucosamine transferase subunit ALG14 homolog isoform X2 [Panthera leo]XP_060481084.1 UDP-N-acetylglucosamine transferase subunit ALG14 homolog isoform X2 [Panthera onca]
MVSVLILAAAGAAVAVLLLALRLWVVLHSRVLVPRQSLSLLVVAGSGGHTTEILRLLEHLSNAYSPRHYIIADTDEMSAHKINSFERNRADRDPSTMFPEYFIHRIPRSREVQQSWLSTMLTTLYSMWLSFPLTHRVKPDLKIIEVSLETTMMKLRSFGKDLSGHLDFMFSRNIKQESVDDN